MDSSPDRALVRRLHGARLFAGLPDDVIGTLAAATTPNTYAPRATLWREGDTAQRVVSITTGLVEITRQSTTGEPSTWALFGPREAIGVPAALAASPYPADAIALTAVTTLEVRADALVDLMTRRGDVALALNRGLLDHTRALHHKIGIMTAGPVAQRLATLLLELVARFGDDGDDGITRIPITLTRAQLAALVGARVETVIRALSAWQKAGWLSTTRDGLELTADHPLAALVDMPSPR